MKTLFCGAVVGTLIIASTLSNANELSVTIMGSGSPIYNGERASAGVLISKGDTKILVDMGPGVRANLYKAGVDDRKLDAMLFTHHHIDHNAEFNSMLVRGILGRDAISIYGPTGTTKFTQAYLDLYEEDIAYRLGKSGRSLVERKNMIVVNDLHNGDSFSIDDIQITTLEVPHTIETLAYRFDYKNQSIVVTGDLTYTDKLPSFAKGADYMIIDSGGMKMKSDASMKRKRKRAASKQNTKRAHLNLNDSSLLAGQSNVNALVYTHFLPGKVDEEASLKVIRKNFSGEVIFSSDLLELFCNGETAVKQNLVR